MITSRATTQPPAPPPFACIETDPVKILGRAMKELHGTQPTVDALFTHMMGTMSRAQILEHAPAAEEHAYALMRGEA